MVNYKRVVFEVAVLTVMVAVVTGAPADCDRMTHYDQRQNGTENYRLNIDGVVIAVAPVDSLLAAASDLDLSDLLDIEDFSELQKPKPPVHHEKPPKPLLEPKPQESKPEDAKPQESKPETPAKPSESALSDVSLDSDIKGQKKELTVKKQDKAQRLKNRLANILIPLLRRNRHH